MGHNRQSLLRQAGLRLWLAFLAALLIVGGASGGFYFAALKRSAAIHGDSLAGFYRDRLRQIEGSWEGEAIGLGRQLDRSNALGSPAGIRRGAERFFTALGEEMRFAAVQIDDHRERVLYKRGATLAGVSDACPADAPPFWHYDPLSRILHRVYSLPVRLVGGGGHLHWYAAIDNGFLLGLTAVGSELYALREGKLVASSTGLPPPEGVASLEDDRDIIQGDRVTIQRRLDWGADPERPTLVLRHQVANPISGGELLVSAVVILAVMALSTCLVLGRWLLRTGRRVSRLGEGCARFGRSQRLTPEVTGPMSEAAAACDDEIRNLASALDELMRGVVEREKERDEKEEARRAADLARGLIAVQEEERRGLAQSLHESTSPNLAAIKLNLDLIAEELREGQPTTFSRLKEMMALLDETSASLRDIGFELRPASLDYFGLVSAIDSYAQQFLRRAGIAVRVDAAALEAQQLPHDLENAAFRIVQEALANCAKHSGARSVTIVLEGGRPKLRIDIADDGIGFDAATLERPGLGLLTMRERAELAGGRLEFESHPGGGTRIRVELRAAADAAMASQPVKA